MIALLNQFVPVAFFYVSILIKLTVSVLILHAMIKCSNSNHDVPWTKRLPAAFCISCLMFSAALQIATVDEGPWSGFILMRDIVLTAIGALCIIAVWTRRQDDAK
jgi:hypothetical protein